MHLMGFNWVDCYYMCVNAYVHHDSVCMEPHVLMHMVISYRCMVCYV